MFNEDINPSKKYIFLRLKKNMKTTKIGEFKIKSSKIIVSDPSYKKQYAGTGKPVLGNLSKIVSRVKTGTWSGFTLKNKEKKSRIWSLVAMNNDINSADLSNWQSIGDVAVDSGMMGIFDAKYYPEENEEFYEQVLKTMGMKHNAVMFQSFGVISSTGNGDGAYPAYKCLIGGRVVAIQIDF